MEPQPAVSLGAPKEDKDKFDEYQVDGITVYLSSNAPVANDELSILLKKVLFSSKLVVEGLAY